MGGGGGGGCSRMSVMSLAGAGLAGWWLPWLQQPNWQVRSEPCRKVSRCLGHPPTGCFWLSCIWVSQHGVLLVQCPGVIPRRSSGCVPLPPKRPVFHKVHGQLEEFAEVVAGGGVPLAAPPSTRTGLLGLTCSRPPEFLCRCSLSEDEDVV